MFSIEAGKSHYVRLIKSQKTESSYARLKTEF